jgi:hypothetical protein
MRRVARELSSRQEHLRHHPGNCGVGPLSTSAAVPSPSLHVLQIASTSKSISAGILLKMESTTPTQEPRVGLFNRQRARSKSPRSRPTTPLRASSRSSLRDSVQRGKGAASSGNALEHLQDGFAELSDAMADLEQNFVQLQLMHESLARFSESFAGFLYGMNMNAFCVDFPEVGASCLGNLTPIFGFDL